MRKLRELLPALFYQNDWIAVSDVLADPQYVDGYLRCGWYRDLMQQFMELGQHKCLYGIHQKLLSLLQDNAMQFQLWGDSFLPVAAEAHIYPQRKIADMGWQYVLRYKSQPVTHKNILQNKILLLNATNVKIAVKGDGTLAIIDGDVLKRYGLNLRSEIYPRCYISVINAFMYWKGDTLFVRDDSRRISFCDTGSELVLIGDEKCPSSVDLYSDNINKIIRAGGFDERDYADYFKDPIFEYHSNGILKETELFYSDIEDIRCFCHGAFCAVLLNQRILEIVDLDQRLVLVSFLVPNACLVYWNPQGTEVLVVFESDRVLRLPCNGQKPIPLARPSMSMKEYAKVYEKRKGNWGVWDILQFSCPVNRRDTPAHIGSVLGSRRPVYATFSIKGDRLACYYYYLNQSVIRLFRLSDREIIAESTVDPIFLNDSVEQPISFNKDGSAMILISRGKRHLWKMNSLTWEHNVEEALGNQTEFVHSLQTKYACDMKLWLLPEYSGIHQHKESILSIMRKVLMLLLSPLVCSKETSRNKNILLHQSIQNIPIVESGGFWWILDRYHSMIHVCDNDGEWVCHGQLQEEIFDFNVIDCTVYVLPVDLSDPIQLDMVSV